MPSAVAKLGLFAAVLLAVFFQAVLKDTVWLLLGIGKQLQPLSDFPYECRRIVDERLQACEDMWLSENTRVLYLACSDSKARSNWLPNTHNFNWTGRSQRDAIVALQIDSPAGDSFQYRALSTPGFSGTAGDGLLHLVGLDGVDVLDGEASRVELMLVNNGPSVDPTTGKPFPDQSATGANTTLELFEIRNPETGEMTHVRTIANEAVTTPNNVALMRDSDSFYITNDHGPYKTGLTAQLSPLFGSGDVVFCSPGLGKGCKRVSKGHKFPNGLAYHGGLVYVPSSALGGVQVFRIAESNELEKVEDIPIDYILDNISVDANGDLYVAAFAKGLDMPPVFQDPFNAKARSTVVRIRKGEDGRHSWEKVLEDAEGETLPASTTVVHDARTGRLFLSSVVSPFITVCEPRA